MPPVPDVGHHNREHANMQITACCYVKTEQGTGSGLTGALISRIEIRHIICYVLLKEQGLR
nr:uncharacterized protein CTRU02_08828 [Colletotrichum truncatum]KAF6789581.1 hypothetical protein CTRU02_08828 [Colletotrichum truncatum]